MFSKTLKDSLDIIEVASRYLPDLKSAGRTYKSNCPFHEERTPSFVIFPETQSWRCFGACVEGGDVISFVMKIEKIDFQHAIKLLADSGMTTRIIISKLVRPIAFAASKGSLDKPSIVSYCNFPK